MKEKSVTKSALVTGASRGIGKSIVLKLAQDGFDIVFCYRQAGTSAQQVKDEIEKLGRRVYMQQCDICNFNDTQNFIKIAEEKLGPLKVIVNNAGIIKDQPLVLMNQKNWQDVIDTNLNGVFNICRAAVFNLIKRKDGCIINISSVAGVYGNPSQTNYSASKAGVNIFSKTLAKEVGSYGIRVNVVAPGFINTDMTEGVNSKMLDKVMSSIPLNRVGEADEVAELVSFLASDRAKYITGQIIQIDGGIVL
ncbi:MAG: 3-oxoacyl-[acyl-carrier-protein] reductase [Cyanobacteriota bacterium]|jgi:3-oxoacyl-[acyl-carrier protein] reductase